MNQVINNFTLYERIGGMPVLESLVVRFYDLMDLEPKYQILREVHGNTLEEAGKRLRPRKVRILI